MRYQIIHPPIFNDFEKRTRQEIRSYKDWFISAIPERLAHLEANVKSTPGYLGWKADVTPESLRSLDRWFASQVQTQKTTRAELEALKAQLTFPVDLPDARLTERTVSVAIDIGMYLGEVVLAHVAGTKWEQVLKDKRNADYGQLVVTGLGKMPFNPVRVAIVVASKYADGMATGLPEVYSSWTSVSQR